MSLHLGHFTKKKASPHTHACCTNAIASLQALYIVFFYYARLCTKICNYKKKGQSRKQARLWLSWDYSKIISIHKKLQYDCNIPKYILIDPDSYECYFQKKTFCAKKQHFCLKKRLIFGKQGQQTNNGCQMATYWKSKGTQRLLGIWERHYHVGEFSGSPKNWGCTVKKGDFLANNTPPDDKLCRFQSRSFLKFPRKTDLFPKYDLDMSAFSASPRQI